MVQDLRIKPESSADWQLLVNLRQKARKKAKKLLRIPAFDLGVVFNVNFLAVQVIVPDAPNTWVKAGYLRQKYNFPSLSTSEQSHFLELNTANLIKLRNQGDFNYKLIYYPQPYFTEVRVKVWRYVGQEISFLESSFNDTQTSLNNNLNVDLSEVVARLNTLSLNLDNSYLGLTDDLGDLVSKIKDLQESLSNIDTDVLLELQQLDAGIFTLFEALKNLIPASEANQLETALKSRLDLNEEFL